MPRLRLAHPDSPPRRLRLPPTAPPCPEYPRPCLAASPHLATSPPRRLDAAASLSPCCASPRAPPTRRRLNAVASTQPPRLRRATPLPRAPSAAALPASCATDLSAAASPRRRAWPRRLVLAAPRPRLVALGRRFARLGCRRPLRGRFASPPRLASPPYRRLDPVTSPGSLDSPRGTAARRGTASLQPRASALQLDSTRLNTQFNSIHNSLIPNLSRSRTVLCVRRGGGSDAHSLEQTRHTLSAPRLTEPCSGLGSIGCGDWAYSSSCASESDRIALHLASSRNHLAAHHTQHVHASPPDDRTRTPYHCYSPITPLE